MWIVLGLMQHFPTLEQAQATRARLRQDFNQQLPPGGLMLAPMSPGMAPRAGSVRPLRTLLRYVNVANVYQLPALIPPVVEGTPGRLPVAFQLMARPGEDWRLLLAGHPLEQAL